MPEAGRERMPPGPEEDASPGGYLQKLWDRKGRKGLLVVAKFSLAAALLFALFHYDIIEVATLAALADHPGRLAGSLFLAFCTIPLATLRWRLLLRTQGIEVGFYRLFQIYSVGLFSANFLPGATSGDAVRFLYLYKDTPGRRALMATSIMAERAIGAYMLLALVTVLIVLGREPIMANAQLTALATVFVAVFAGGTLVIAGALALRGRLNLAERLSGWQTRSKLHYLVAAVIGGIVNLAARPASLVAAAAVTVAIHTASIASVVNIALTIPGGSLGAADYSLASALGMLAGQLPLTPGGIGVAEGAFAEICYLFEGARTGAAYGSVFLAFRGLFILSTLVGAVYLVLAPVKQKRGRDTGSI